MENKSMLDDLLRNKFRYFYNLALFDLPDWGWDCHGEYINRAGQEHCETKAKELLIEYLTDIINNDII